jgi:hypothetical protein
MTLYARSDCWCQWKQFQPINLWQGVSLDYRYLLVIYAQFCYLTWFISFIFFAICIEYGFISVKLFVQKCRKILFSQSVQINKLVVLGVKHFVWFSGLILSIMLPQNVCWLTQLLKFMFRGRQPLIQSPIGFLLCPFLI